MNNDFMRFAERAIERAGKAGETKRAFKREQAGALAESSMAELERSQLGKTRRTGMKQAGALARTKLGGGSAGGYTSSQTANLKKHTYGLADTEIERLRELGELGYGKGKTFVPMDEGQISEFRESFANERLNELMGGGTQKPAARNPRDGLGSLTMGGDTYNVDDRLPFGKDITKVQKRAGLAGAVSSPRNLTGTNLSAEKPAWTKPGATRGTAATQLAAEYKKETATPLIGAGLLNKFRKAWEERKPSPYVTPPSGLKGYMGR